VSDPPSSEPPEQPLQFPDRRATVVVVVGLVALALVGALGGALFRDACDELFTVGERRTFVHGDPALVLPADAGGVQALLAYGRGAGLGAWRGSVALDAGAELVATPDGFLVFTAAGIDALEPGLMAVNASRGTAGRRALPAFAGAAVGEAGEAPFEVAVLDENLALIGCGTVVRDDPVLAVDRVRALHAHAATLSAVGLDGDEDWSRTFEHPLVRADLLLGAALATTTGDMHLVDLGGGRTRQRWVLPGAEVLTLDARHAVVRTSDRLMRLSFVDGAETEVDVDPSAGVMLVGDRVVAGAGLPALPGGLEVTDVRATHGGYLALEVASEGRRLLLLYGPADASAVP
jgi:hypothetical protein